MNRIITAIDEEILELDAKAAKLRMLRQAAVSIAEDGGEALVEGVPVREIEAPEPTVTPTPPPEPAASVPSASAGDRHQRIDYDDLNERVYAAIAAGDGDWIVSGGAMAEELGVSKATLGRSREQLEEGGRVEKRGRGPGTRWRVTGRDAPPDPPARGAPVPAKAETAESESRKAANIGKAKGEDRRLLAIIEEAGVDGVDSVEVAAALDCSRASARGRLISFARSGRVVRFDSEGGGSRYRLKAHGLLPVDADGCKTNVERKLLEAVQRAPVALTTVEVAANAKVPMIDAGRVLHGLAKRGVVRAIPLKTDTSPQRWELPKAMAEAA